MYMNMKRKGREQTIFDLLDAVILKFITDSVKKGKKPTITEVRIKTGLTHANLITHLKRLEKLIQRERDKQTIYLSLTKIGKKLMIILDDAYKLGETTSNKKIKNPKANLSKEKIKLEGLKKKEILLDKKL